MVGEQVVPRATGRNETLKKWPFSGRYGAQMGSFFGTSPYFLQDHVHTFDNNSSHGYEIERCTICKS